jgi:hypothetical protein
MDDVGCASGRRFIIGMKFRKADFFRTELRREREFMISDLVILGFALG